jgi:hypothetical protein
VHPQEVCCLYPESQGWFIHLASNASGCQICERSSAYSLQGSHRPAWRMAGSWQPQPLLLLIGVSHLRGVLPTGEWLTLQALAWLTACMVGCQLWQQSASALEGFGRGEAFACGCSRVPYSTGGSNAVMLLAAVWLTMCQSCGLGCITRVFIQTRDAWTRHAEGSSWGWCGASQPTCCCVSDTAVCM